jgi:hypothetical protein
VSVSLIGEGSEIREPVVPTGIVAMGVTGKSTTGTSADKAVVTGVGMMPLLSVGFF